MRPYGDYADEYLDKGFFPIPASGKQTVKDGHHGRDAPLVTESEVSEWQELHPRHNIAARLPRDVIGIDVDAYGSKHGQESLDDLEELLGRLPATVVSTARDDDISGIRLYRIPEHYWSVVWPGKAGDGIDILWHGNRYAIVWPSRHPDTGQTYRWYEQFNGTFEPLDDIPDIDEIPLLPRDWLEYLAKPGADDDQADVASSAEWIKANGAGNPCDQMKENIRKATESMAENAHDTARDGTLAIAKDAASGHAGGYTAMRAVYDLFRDVMEEDRGPGRRSGARSEWRRHMDGAVRRAEAILQKAGGVRPEDPCKVWSGEVQIRRVSKAVLWAKDVPKTRVEWLQKPLVPFGALSIVDGDPGQGKSTICDSMVALAVQGRPILPFGEHCGRPVKCGLIGAEDDIESVVKGRLEAAGYTDEEHGEMVAFYRLQRRRGHLEQITFPEGVERVRSWIMTAGLEFVVVDPVTSFLGENVKSHVDASVRAALSPLGAVARDTGCAILLVRHLNKNGQFSAMYRGGGSVAFSAIARSGMITGVLPDSEGNRFGIAQVKCSNARKMAVTLAYSIEGSAEDSEIAVVEWHGEASLSADELAAGPKSKRGPDAAAQNEVRDILQGLFDKKDTWPAAHIQAALKQNGFAVDSPTVRKVKYDLGIRSRYERQRGRAEGRGSWVWTVVSEKLRA